LAMKIHARTLLVVAGVLLAAVATNAQTTNTVTDVPFEFTVGTTTLPRDSYEVTRITGQNGAFLIRGARRGVVVISQPEGPSATDNSPRLVFHRYNDRYFLREVRLPGNNGFRLPKTAAEIDAAERLAAGVTHDVVAVRTRPE
jgi:hypothetical protein